MLFSLVAAAGNAFEPMTMFRHAVANVICSVVFGSRYSYSDAAFLELLNAIGNYISFFLSPVAKVRARRAGQALPLPWG